MTESIARLSGPRPPDVETVRRLLGNGEAARALQLVGDRWSFLVMRDAFLGVRRFEDFRSRTGASRGTLTARLNALFTQGVFYRSPYGHRFEYCLTEKGLAFYPVALCMWIWEKRWGGEYGLPPRLIHDCCGKTLKPLMVCGHCTAEIDRRAVDFELGPGARRGPDVRSVSRRRNTTAKASGDTRDTTMFHCVDTVGDRWTALLVGALFLGLRRYDDINAALGIATNILADRLRRLVSAGVIEQQLYRQRPPRHEYRLTAKGWDLFPFTLALHDWGTRWIQSPHGPSMCLQHRSCGRRLRPKLVCAACREVVEARDVSLGRSIARPTTLRYKSR